MKENETFSIFKYYKNAIDGEQNFWFFDKFSIKFLKSNYIRWFIKLGQNHTFLFRLIILTLIFTHSILIRQFAFIKYGKMIHEFDPYFNLRATQYLEQHGLKAFWNWFDDASWYPLGRPTGHTLYPGLMITSYSLHTLLNFLGIYISIKDICVFVGPLFSGFTSILAYLIGVETTHSPKAGLLAAFFMSISPSYISRSVSGSYDNEAVAIFALVLSFYLYLKAINLGTLLHTLFASLGSFYMVTTWGGYVFVVNTIAVFMVILALLDRLTHKEHMVYTSYYLLLNVLLINIPFVGFNAFKSSEHMGPHGVFILSHAYFLIKYVQNNIPIVNFKKLIKIISYLGVLIFILIFIIFSVLGKTNWSGRSLTLLDPTYAPNRHPLIASVSEHQSPAWANYPFDLGPIIVLCPLGIYVCLKSSKNSLFFIPIYALLAFYFSGIMIRLLLVVAPAACILAGIGLSFFLENFMNYLRPPNLNSYVKFHNHESKKLNKIVGFQYSPILILSIITAIGYLCYVYVKHCTWVSAEAFSHPTIVTNVKYPSGEYLQDDYREAYTWLKYNTHKESRILSWWDYGYQTSSLANRTVFVDNNTWNHTHIATVGLIMSSDEENAFQISKKLDVDYILVVFGGFSGTSSDDINKFIWMIKIAGGDFPAVQHTNFLNRSGQYTVNESAPDKLFESLLYKFCYYQIHKLTGGFDSVRKQRIGKEIENLKYFDEIFTSENFLVRIFKVKPEPNFLGNYAKGITDTVKDRILKSGD